MDFSASVIQAAIKDSSGTFASGATALSDPVFTYEPHGTTGTGTPPTPPDSRLAVLSTVPNLTDSSQQTINFESSDTPGTDSLITQFGISLTTLSPYIVGNAMPPGIWDLNFYGRSTGSGNGMVGINFYLFGVDSSNGLHRIGGGSSVADMTNQTVPSYYTSSLIIPGVVDLSTYSYLTVAIVGHYDSGNTPHGVIYFMTNDTYSHIHTSFAISGQTGPTGPTGPLGISLVGNTGYIGGYLYESATLASGYNWLIDTSGSVVTQFVNVPTVTAKYLIIAQTIRHSNGSGNYYGTIARSTTKPLPYPDVSSIVTNLSNKQPLGFSTNLLSAREDARMCFVSTDATAQGITLNMCVVDTPGVTGPCYYSIWECYTNTTGIEGGTFVVLQVAP